LEDENIFESSDAKTREFAAKLV